MRRQLLWPTGALTMVLLAGCADQSLVTSVDSAVIGTDNGVMMSSSGCEILHPVEVVFNQNWGVFYPGAVDEDVPDDDGSYVSANRYGPNPITVSGAFRIEQFPSPPPGSTAQVKVRWKVVGPFSTEYPPTMLDIRLANNLGIFDAFSIWPSSSYTTRTRAVNASEAYRRGLKVQLDATLKPIGFNQIQARVTWVAVKLCTPS